MSTLPIRLIATIAIWEKRAPEEAVSSQHIELNYDSESDRYYTPDGRDVEFVLATNPASDVPVVGESWPRDTLHDAARQVVRGAKDLVPSAREAVRGAMDKADAPPTGRAAQDGALGRAIR